jgi:uncharacterized membrane protein YfcA
MFGIPFAEFIGLLGALAGAGIVTGLLAGLFGVGGGAVIVPVLYQVFTTIGVPESVRMHLCVGSSLAIMSPVQALKSIGRLQPAHMLDIGARDCS